MILNKQTKVFIAGCGGMLGDAIYKQFSNSCIVLATDIDLNEKWLTYGDIRDYNEMYKIIESFCPDIIINLAALTDLEVCEKNPENTWKTNALGAKNLAQTSKKLDVPHIYISTAGVFDGRKEYYNDYDAPNPLSMYGKAKYFGEKTVQELLKKYFIFRAGWMMGGGPKKDKKFINKIYKQIVEGKKELFIVDDKLGTPTYTVNFAESIYKIIQTDMYGLYNMVCDGSCSRYDVAVKFIDLLGLKNEIKITKVDSDYFKNEYFAPRPMSEKLINLKLNRKNINYMRHWEDCLTDYVKECYGNK